MALKKKSYQLKRDHELYSIHSEDNIYVYILK